MNKILNKITFFLLIILFFSLPLVNSHLLNLFWIDLGYYVDWNYEFTKVMFFNILSSIIFIIFSIQKIFFCKTKRFVFNKNLVKYFIIFLTILWISTYLSISPYLSLFWSNSKWHWTLMFINLFLLLILLINTGKQKIKLVFKSLIIWVFFLAILAIKEYFIPSLDYWDLWNRALWTMGHPNYLALVILLICPILYNKLKKKHKTLKYKKYLYYLLLFTLIITLFLTKSLFWIIIFIFYSYYFFVYKTRLKVNKKIYNYLFIIIIFLFISISLYLYPEKLNSFLSRYYIWKTTINISIYNIKILIFWWWLDTLDLIFDKYKDIHLYIYENIWFTADRPHNFIINIFYNLWLLWLTFLIYSLFLLKKLYSKLNYIKHKKIYLFEIVFIFLIFNLFNFPSIVSYIIIILVIAKILKIIYKQNFHSIEKEITFSKKIFLIIIILYSIISVNFFIKYYVSEVYTYRENFLKAINIFKYTADNYYRIWKNEKWLKIWKYKSEYYYISLIYFSKDYNQVCKNLLKDFPISENYFLCWDLLYKLRHKEKAIIYYKKWLNLMPDLWNSSSKYYSNFLTKNIISRHRFFSEKYSDIQNILKIVNNTSP